MALEKLTIDNLGDLNGGLVRGMVNRSLDDALRDVEDRGHDEKPRKVTIVVEFLKINNNQVATDVRCQVGFPPLRSEATIGNVVYQDGEPQVQFQTMSPNDPNQRTFPQLEEKEEQ